MARTRAFRRAQRERVRRNRIQRARDLWSLMSSDDPGWIERQGRKWTKTDPFTQCSCDLCRNLFDPRAEVDEIAEWANETY